MYIPNGYNRRVFWSEVTCALELVKLHIQNSKQCNATLYCLQEGTSSEQVHDATCTWDKSVSFCNVQRRYLKHKFNFLGRHESLDLLWEIAICLHIINLFINLILVRYGKFYIGYFNAYMHLYERRVDPKVPGSSPTVSWNWAMHYLLQSSFLLLKTTMCLHITFDLPYISEILIILHWIFQCKFMYSNVWGTLIVSQKHLCSS